MPPSSICDISTDLASNRMVVFYVVSEMRPSQVLMELL
jgi:hypothetical protein